MSNGLKITFLVHALVAVVFGIAMYLQPGPWAAMVNWSPRDDHMSRIYGAALLAFAVSSWLGYRATRWDEVRIVVQMEIALTALSILGGLWGFFLRGAPAFAGIAVLIWIAFAAAWIYFYRKHLAQT